MKREVIHTNNAPGAIGPYSQGIKAGNTIYVSGQLPINPETGDRERGRDIKEETRIFMNKYQISEEFSKKIDDYYCEFGFYKENNKEVCLYFDIIEMLDMFINLDD